MQISILYLFIYMYRFRKDGISVLTVVDRRRKKNNGLYPVKIEVIYRRVQKYFPTGQDVSDQEWESFLHARRRPRKCANIENSFYLIRNAVEQLAQKGEFSFRRLEARLGRSDDTVNEAIKEKMNFLLKQGKINSFYRYRSTLHGIEKFAGEKVCFNSVTPSWLRKCEKSWKEEGKNCTTISIYMKTLRSIFNKALDEGIIREGSYPFGKNGYMIPASSPRKLALTKSQIEKVRHWKGESDIEYWRDLWMFSYLCNGINFRDMIFLKYKDICDGEITFIRSKTADSRKHVKTIHATITPLMREIMERSGNGADGDGEKFIFRHARGGETPMEVSLLVRSVISSCNSAMKRLANDIGIPAFSTYAARHSFATILKKSGADISFISESLGHTSLAMTENYLAGYDKEERQQFVKSLIGEL